MKATIGKVEGRIPIVLEVVDISGDRALEAQYGEDIPVLLIDGRKAAKHRISERQLEEKLTGVRRS